MEKNENRPMRNGTLLRPCFIRLDSANVIRQNTGIVGGLLHCEIRIESLAVTMERFTDLHTSDIYIEAQPEPAQYGVPFCAADMMISNHLRCRKIAACCATPQGGPLAGCLKSSRLAPVFFRRFCRDACADKYNKK